MKKKSILDLQNQTKRISDKLEKLYDDTTAQDSEIRNHGLWLWNLHLSISKKYSENISNYLGGKDKVSGNMRLLRRKVNKSIYEG